MAFARKMKRRSDRVQAWSAGVLAGGLRASSPAAAAVGGGGVGGGERLLQLLPQNRRQSRQPLLRPRHRRRHALALRLAQPARVRLRPQLAPLIELRSPTFRPRQQLAICQLPAMSR